MRGALWRIAAFPRPPWGAAEITDLLKRSQAQGAASRAALTLTYLSGLLNTIIPAITESTEQLCLTRDEKQGVQSLVDWKWREKGE